MDQSILYLFNITLASPILDSLFVILTNRGYLLYIPISIYLYVIQKDRRASLVSLLVLLAVFALNDWISNEAKTLFFKQRPCITLHWIRDVIGCSQSSSMPSSHASNAFAVASGLYYYLWIAKTGLVIRLLPFAVASVIALSRIYLGVHYPSDVIAGALLGMAIAAIGIALSNLFLRYYKKRPVEAVLLLLTIGLSLFRIYYIRHGGLDLSPDEAHYWEWSRRLDWSYYSKGPLVAWMIKAGTLIFGNTVMAIRLNAVIMLALSGLIIYKLTRDLYVDGFVGSGALGQSEGISKQAGLLASIMLHTIPMFSTFGMVFTIDSPLIFLWTASLYLLWRLKDSQRSLRLWSLLGITVGLGLLAKYTMAFFIGCAFLYLVLYDRKTLLKPYPYVGLILSLLVFMPVVIWNHQYDWVSLRHTAGMAKLDPTLTIDWRHLFEFIGSQIGVISPFLFFMMLVALYKVRGLLQGRVAGFMLCFCVPVLVFFLFRSLQGKVQANWALPGYISAIIAVSVVWVSGMTGSVASVRLMGIAVLIAFLINVVGLYPQLINLPVKIDPSARLRGWSMLAERIDGIIAPFSRDRHLFIFSPDYQLSSELAFYMKGNPFTYSINLGRRMNQYDLWEPPNSAIKRIRAESGQATGLFVHQLGEDISHAITPRCDRYQKHTIDVNHKGRHLRSYNLLICYNISSVPDMKAQNY